MLVPQADCFTAVGGLRHDDHVFLSANDRCQSLQYRYVIVGHEHTNLVRLQGPWLPGSHVSASIAVLPCASDNTIVAVVPTPGTLSMVSLPPISSTRSRIPRKPNPSWRAVGSKPSPSSRKLSRTVLPANVSSVMIVRG